MDSVLALGWSLLGGAALGALAFGSLWLSVRRLPAASRPVMLMLGGSLLRTAGSAAGLYLIMDGRWERLAAALVGFLAVRSLLVRRLGPSSAARRRCALEA
jgi:F1F0 ATPase subunit 2